MRFLVEWVSRNRLVVVLLVVVGYLLVGGNGSVRPLMQRSSQQKLGLAQSETFDSAASNRSLGAPAVESIGIVPPFEPEVPPTEAEDRLVIRDTNMSLVVDDVAESISQVESVAAGVGGFLVNSQLSVPEGAASGLITIRVPEDERNVVLEQIRALGVRVVSENVRGRDVTDEYVDMDARLEVLETTKGKFEGILAQASRVEDLLRVQRELTNLQAQIDNLKGRQKFLEQSAKLTKITVFMSTDELALPYTPDEVWRPQVVFRQAVRSLVSTARDGIDLLIKLVVFAPVWLPVVGIVWWVGRRRRG